MRATHVYLRRLISKSTYFRVRALRRSGRRNLSCPGRRNPLVTRGFRSVATPTLEIGQPRHLREMLNGVRRVQGSALLSPLHAGCWLAWELESLVLARVWRVHRPRGKASSLSARRMPRLRDHPHQQAFAVLQRGA